MATGDPIPCCHCGSYQRCACFHPVAWVESRMTTPTFHSDEWFADFDACAERKRVAHLLGL